MKPIATDSNKASIYPADASFASMDAHSIIAYARQQRALVAARYIGNTWRFVRDLMIKPFAKQPIQAVQATASIDVEHAIAQAHHLRGETLTGHIDNAMHFAHDLSIQPPAERPLQDVQTTPVNVERIVAQAHHLRAMMVANSFNTIARLPHRWLIKPLAVWNLRRKMFNRLSALDNRTLTDIGIDRWDIPRIVEEAYAKAADGTVTESAVVASLHRLETADGTTAVSIEAPTTMSPVANEPHKSIAA